MKWCTTPSTKPASSEFQFPLSKYRLPRPNLPPPLAVPCFVTIFAMICLQGTKEMSAFHGQRPFHGLTHQAIGCRRIPQTVSGTDHPPLQDDDGGSLHSGHHQWWRRYRLCPIYAHSSAPHQLPSTDGFPVVALRELPPYCHCRSLAADVLRPHQYRQQCPGHLADASSFRGVI